MHKPLLLIQRVLAKEKIRILNLFSWFNWTPLKKKKLILSWTKFLRFHHILFSEDFPPKVCFENIFCNQNVLETAIIEVSVMLTIFVAKSFASCKFLLNSPNLCKSARDPGECRPTVHSFRALTSRQSLNSKSAWE